jgi:hypothetical protein
VFPVEQSSEPVVPSYTLAGRSVAVPWRLHVPAIFEQVAVD